MTREATTPGHIWYEIPHSRVMNGDFGGPHATVVNLHESYPLDEARLAAAWEGRHEEEVAGPGDQTFATTVFNRGAGQKGLWLPGWGVSNRRGGGAQVVAAMAALNPGVEIITTEEPEGVSEAIKEAAAKGNMQPYADSYTSILDHYDTRPSVRAGHSRGALIQLHLGRRHDAGRIKTFSLADIPRAKHYLSAVKFGAKVGGLDNRVQRRYAEQVDKTTEAMLQRVISVPGDTLKETAAKARAQWWLIKSMRYGGLLGIAEDTVAAQPEASVFWWHGTENIGVPVKATRRVIAALRSDMPAAAKRVHYFEAPTGHYSEGNTALNGEKLAYARDHS
jgi:pimeloyl-ACP methyl ester carboxylesterase